MRARNHKRIVEALASGMDYSTSKCAFAHRPGICKMIEVNPRMAAQFSDLLRKSRRHQPARRGAENRTGEPVDLTPARGKYAVATSFVFPQVRRHHHFSRAPSNHDIQG